MKSLDSKIARLEQAGEQLAHRRRVAEWRDAGLGARLAELAARAEEQAPPVSVPGGTDLEPLVRKLAELIAADVEQMIVEVRQEMADTGILRPGPGLVEADR